MFFSASSVVRLRAQCCAVTWGKVFFFPFLPWNGFILIPPSSYSSSSICWDDGFAKRRSWVTEGHADWILILVNASCGNFPEHMQKKKYRVKCPLLPSPLLPRRYELPAIKDGVSCLRRQKTHGELTVVPLCWNSMRVVPDATWLHRFIQCVETRGTRKRLMQ